MFRTNLSSSDDVDEFGSFALTVVRECMLLSGLKYEI